MLFEAAPEEAAQRISEALLAAEMGNPDAWRLLSEGALYRLRCDADILAGLVPIAFLSLTRQLAMHPRSGVRVEAVRYATLVWPYAPEQTQQLLAQLATDLSRGVQRAAQLALGRVPGASVVEMSASL
jgi:hypothetical protein